MSPAPVNAHKMPSLPFVRALLWAGSLSLALAAPLDPISAIQNDPSLRGLSAIQRQNIIDTKTYFTERQMKMGAVKTTTMPNGQIIDWIPRDSQGKIASPPPAPPIVKRGVQENPAPKPILEMEGAERGPEGTVPVARYNLENLDANIALEQRMSKPAYPGMPENTGLPPDQLDSDGCPLELNGTSNAAAQPHWYASSAQQVNNHGGVGVFSMFSPFVENPAGDFSLLQTAVIHYNVPVAGGGTTSQTVEAGWINYPSQIQAPHLFSFYTTNGYASNGDNIGGWNRDQAGWVQTDATIFPGTTFSPLATDGGTQYDLMIRYYLQDGNWWLWVVDRYIGYYPASLFTKGVNSADTLESGSSQINFYGEIYQSEAQTTTTDMGSGEFPETGFGHSAYIHNIAYTEADGTDIGYDGGAQLIQSDTSRYRINPAWNSGSDWGSYVYLGGPGAGGKIGG